MSTVLFLFKDSHLSRTTLDSVENRVYQVVIGFREAYETTPSRRAYTIRTQ